MSPDTHQQYALLEYYQTEGWKLLKVDPKTKGGVDAQWQLREAPIKDVRRYLDNGGGVGIQLGEVSNWLAVADADNEYAVKLAPAFLPDTLKQAKGNEVSHFFFYSENLGYEQFNDLNGNRLIDVKASNNGAGHLVVVEPSPHPTKGSYIQFC